MKILIKDRQRRRHLNKDRIIRASRRILSHLNQPKAELSILFVGDKQMTRLNAEFRGVHRTTDVLSFEAAITATGGEAQNVLGDVVINVPQAELQAKEYNLGVYAEIHRLLVHGILHLLGYDHERSVYYEKQMKKKEREILHATQEMD
jgi:probable rRNA maturation factor